MKIQDVVVGTKLTMVEGGGEYVVTRKFCESIELEHTKIVAGMAIYLNDLPEMFEGVSASK